jgi:anthranilate synthase component 1
MAEMSLEEVKGEAGRLGYPCIIPLVRVRTHTLNPVDVYASLRKDSTHSFLLESAILGEKIARYSFLGRDPVEVLRLKDEADPLGAVRTALPRYRVSRGRLPPFFGGLIGYFSYDIIRHFEDIGDATEDDLHHPEAELMFVKDLVIFDHWREEILLVSNLILETEDHLEGAYAEGIRALEGLEEALEGASPIAPAYNGGHIQVRSNFKKREFEEAVRRAKEYIYAGDIFQVVLSQRFECPAPKDPFNTYLVLKELNPSPYMYFLEMGELKIIGTSPEILVKVQGDRATVRPIAGTRPRGKDAVEDESLRREMVNDGKERAEHTMLVDLGRNDLGKVSRFGTVVVDEFMEVEKYSHVQHMVSNVTGTLEKGKDAFDALEASFPAGTVSGAPKVRAMEIIEELEPTRRGIYAGCLGYISFQGDMDMAITIRTIVVQKGRAYVQAGAGIVADSVPEKEYQETVNKGKGMLKAIELSGVA